MFKYDKSSTSSYSLGTQLTFNLLEYRPDNAKRIYISPKQCRDETYEKLVKLAKSKHIPIIENNEKIFRDLSDKDNVMVIGEFEKYKDDLDEKANHIVLVNPSNMGNLGTIIRCAAAFSILDIAIIGPAADSFDPKVIRSSMGAIFPVRISRFKTFEEYELKYGLHNLYPFMLQAKTKLKELQIAHPFSIIFGNEATGLPASFLEKGTPVVIPNSPLVDSLNIDNAAAIGIYEFTK